MLKTCTVCSIILFLGACGGGGGNNSDQGNSFAQPQSLQIRWQPPSQRANGEALTPEEIQAYAIILVRWEDIAQQQSAAFDNFVSLQTFLDNQAQLAAYLAPNDVKQLIDQGHPNIIFSATPNKTQYTIENLQPGRYYIALSAIDYQYQYSDLSDTLTATIP